MSNDNDNGANKSNFASYVVTVGLLLGMLGAAWCLRPFPDVILAKSVPILGLTRAQRMNIQKAAATLDGTVIAPGGRFSFNNVVGPRSERHGYLPAPAYVGVATQQSIGGGVCLVSSIVYQLALESGLKIDQRTAHMKTIRTVPPGLDATVWYGQTDLSFTNTTSSPLKISTTTTSGNVVRLQLLGNRSLVPLWLVQRKPQSGSPGTVCVDVTRTNGDKQEMVSHDIYGLGHHPTTIASRGGSNYAN